MSPILRERFNDEPCCRWAPHGQISNNNPEKITLARRASERPETGSLLAGELTRIPKEQRPGKKVRG